MRFDLKFKSTWNADDLACSGLQISKLRKESDPALFGHDQHLAVGIVEIAVSHAFVEGIDVNADAGLGERIAIARDRGDAVDEICWFGRNRQRIPAELIWCRRNFVER